MNITLTKGQEQGLKIAVERYKNKEKWTTIAGFAGVGKSTLIPYIIDELGLSEDEVVYAALTGKAALVLRNKGCKNAITLHKLLYIPKKIKDSGDVEFIPREHLEDMPKLIVVDEASMVSKEIFDLLLSHGVHVIFLGDNFQLPAISDSANILDNPHVTLTEITRQALDSPIIRLSMDIRNNKPLTRGGSKEARIIYKNQVSDKLLLGADIVLCAKNATRRKINRQIRQLRWGDKYQEYPLDGDRLMCQHNYWKITDKDGETPLLNGMILTTHNISMKDTKNFKPKLTAVCVEESGSVFEKSKMNIDYKLLTTGQPTVNKDNWKEFRKVQKPIEMEYAYAATCWKAQGSQWDRVLIFEEDFPYDEVTKRQYLYTAITRGVSQVVLVLK